MWRHEVWYEFRYVSEKFNASIFKSRQAPAGSFFAALPVCPLMNDGLTPRYWRWKQHIPPKRLWSARLHVITSQKPLRLGFFVARNWLRSWLRMHNWTDSNQLLITQSKLIWMIWCAPGAFFSHTMTYTTEAAREIRNHVSLSRQFVCYLQGWA
jgi:hypothetical protein